MRTYRCIAPNPPLDKRTLHNKLIAKELQDDRDARIYSKSNFKFYSLPVTKLSYIT